MDDPNQFDLPRIEASPLLAGVEFRETVESTQTLARDLAAHTDVRMPLLVLASQQTAGRGRGENRWRSASGALTFSVVLAGDRLDRSAGTLAQVSLASALAVCGAVERFAPQAECGIKWPNDVLLDGRKVSGVLIETPAGGRAGRSGPIIVGIGLNVNNSLASDSPEVAGATSLGDRTGRACGLTDVLLCVLEGLVGPISRLPAAASELAGRWRARSVLDGRHVTIRRGNRTDSGRCVGLRSDGALLLETPEGRTPIHSGSVQAVRPPL